MENEKILTKTRRRMTVVMKAEMLEHTKGRQLETVVEDYMHRQVVSHFPYVRNFFFYHTSISDRVCAALSLFTYLYAVQADDPPSELRRTILIP